MLESLHTFLMIIALIPAVLFGQTFDDFSDGDFTVNPTWEGDVDKFIVNSDFQLQLNDMDAGSAQLFVPIDVNTDQTWKFSSILDFSPSQSNTVAIYLFIDDYQNPSYYVSLEYGENGSDDALVFYEYKNGVKSELARGVNGNLSNSPAQVQVEVDRQNAQWNIKTDYTLSGILTNELSFTGQLFDDSQGFFGFSCTYTATRSDLFYFDNIDIHEFEPDLEGPQAVSINNLTENSFEIYFDELIDISSIDQNSVQLSPFVEISNITAINNPSNAILVELASNLDSGPNYTVNIGGIKDVLGNVMEDQQLSFQLYVKPMPGDILITEVLFDPLTDNHDFIELYNHSNKIINLKNCTIENVEKEQFKEISNELLMLPGQYLALTKDAELLRETYQVPDTANIVEQELPSLNVASGNVTLYNIDFEKIDSVNYLESYHYDLLYITKGVSLERINFDQPATDESNWFSASSTVNYATPGYKNSNFVEDVVTDDFFSIPNKNFSPNGDGDSDFINFYIHTNEGGWVITVDIYDTYGQLKRKVANNQLLATQDILRWDGLDEGGQLCDIGHYIVVVNAFDNLGGTIRNRFVINLLNNIK